MLTKKTDWSLFTQSVKHHKELVLPAIESVLEKVKQCFLHHVCYLHRSKEGREEVVFSSSLSFILSA